MNQGELLQAMRSQAVADQQQVAAVVLETDGTFSIIKAGPESRPATLSDVTGP